MVTSSNQTSTSVIFNLKRIQNGRQVFWFELNIDNSIKN
ncbi:hypothetical protein RO3G_10754 [Rhizopus delemar RA 99-880]|uniref:Uncharacterized protein n=1 Tax=Rhizopus delemar (strain RA 99-880 / ATCC MYA-4621 / FGSC 9543 / NRRL 43880) TaxID=246409 RepID=I1CC63_RHIO9|nr:hypothetical protein RO3G_10754 [Rhizopus delemar RA 99-880]|eukprot:EIE86043.1 hypothetical protein RO3G_10754 [Rhizopus delemar RA 99-880]